MRKEPKTAPWPALLLLFPFVTAMTIKDIATWIIDTVWDGLQQLGPRFQGFVLGVWAAMATFVLVASMAMFG